MDSKKIGAFIALNRKKKGLTQEQLGEKLGVTNKTVSRWENGNYMPDLSMLEPLSKELGISLNELLAGEEIKVEEAVEYSEKNLISTIDYSAGRIKNEHRKISIFLIAAGILLCIGAFTILPQESSWCGIYSILGVLFIVAGLFRELPFTSVVKKGMVAAGVFLIVTGIFLIADFIGVSEFKRPPIYRYLTATTFTNTKIIEYRSLFYHVFRVNADTPNEYYIIDTEGKYTTDTVPLSPFDREKSGISNIKKYKSQYVGDNSNTGNLIGALPLSEYGFIFEIDSERCGVTIDYHATDWYVNENLYIEKGMVYNAVSMFSLIDNLQYICFNFTGSSYYVAREMIEEDYPGYEKIIKGNSVQEEQFNKLVEQKMNEEVFITDVFSIFSKTEVEDWAKDNSGE